MNESKEWPMSHTLPTPGLPAHHDTQHLTASSVDHGYPQHFEQSAPSRLPMHHAVPGNLPSNHFIQSKSDGSDPRMSSSSRPDSPTRSDPYPSFHAPPYLPVSRKRNRSDSLFPPENGPTFSPTKMYDNLYALDRITLLMLRIHSKMDRGFFLADSDWTCYRRNYFQVSSTVAIHGMPPMYPEHSPECLVRATDGTLHPVRGFLLGVAARVSNSDKTVDLIQHTPKRDKGPQTTPKPKPIIPGGNLAIGSVGNNQTIVTFERIQFKTATANNGKRRAAQQYYVCVIDLYAQTEQGELIKVASCQSDQLVVRGRSPGHYADSQDRQTRPPPASLRMTTAPQSPHPTSAPQHHPHSGNHDNRFQLGYPRAPFTPPSMIPGDYGSPYPYYTNYASFGQAMPPPHPMMMGNAPPTPTPQQQQQQQQQQPQQQQQQQPLSSSYMMADHSSSQASSPHMYQHPPHPQSNGGLNMQMPMDEWQRPRIHSPQQEHQQAPSYFGQSGTSTQSRSFSPTTPTGPFTAARKLNSVPNICNQPSS